VSELVTDEPSARIEIPQWSIAAGVAAQRS
jgi:hypothetical protein